MCQLNANNINSGLRWSVAHATLTILTVCLWVYSSIMSFYGTTYHHDENCFNIFFAMVWFALHKFYIKQFFASNKKRYLDISSLAKAPDPKANPYQKLDKYFLEFHMISQNELSSEVNITFSLPFFFLNWNIQGVL